LVNLKTAQCKSFCSVGREKIRWTCILYIEKCRTFLKLSTQTPQKGENFMVPKSYQRCFQNSVWGLRYEGFSYWQTKSDKTVANVTWSRLKIAYFYSIKNFECKFDLIGFRNN